MRKREKESAITDQTNEKKITETKEAKKEEEEEEEEEGKTETKDWELLALEYICRLAQFACDSFDLLRRLSAGPPRSIFMAIIQRRN